MSVSANQSLDAQPSGWVAAVVKSIPRDEYFAALFILGCASGFVGRAIEEAAPSGIWTGAILHISTIPLFAAIAGVSLLLRDKDDVVRPFDLAVGAVFLLLSVFSVGALNWVAVTGLSFYILLFARGGSHRRRAAVILLALTASMLWSRVLFATLAHTILQIDAALVSHILGTERNGTLVEFVDQSGQLAILPACSSISNLSLGFLCWVSATNFFKERLSPSDYLWCFLSCGIVVTINVARISFMGLSHASYSLVHGYWGDTVANMIMIALLIGFALVGVRRELFARP